MSLPNETCLSWIVNEVPANSTGTEYRTMRSPGANYNNIQTSSAAYYLWTQKLFHKDSASMTTTVPPFDLSLHWTEETDHY